MTGEEVRAIIRELLGDLAPETVDRLLSAAPRRHLAAGKTLLRQGEPGDSMYILISGRLRALVSGESGKEESVAELAPVEWIGELSLLTGSPRSATILAIRDSELIQISAEAFEDLTRQEPAIALQLARTVTAKLQLMIRQPRPDARISTIALVPLSPAVPLDQIAGALQNALARSGRSRVLTPDSVDEELGAPLAQDDIDQWDQKDSRLAHFLSQVERGHDFILLRADFDWSPWTRRCLRIADLILLVADGSASPGSNAILQELSGEREFPIQARMEMVLAHSGAKSRVLGAASWLARCPVEAHYHLRTAHQPDFERLARRLAGTETALALSGGGARGLVHIGVIRALRELGIPVDRVSGTSMGAVVGAMLAKGLGVEEMIELSYRGWHKMRATRDYTLPIVSLLKAGRVGKMLEMMFDDGRIEDLWLPYFAVSSNLTRAREMVHRTGLIREALRASISMPGMAPPVPHHGDLLVDGAVLDNLPADIQQRVTHGRTIAVDVNPDVDLHAESDYGSSLSAGRLLWSWLNPFVPAIRAPNIFAIIDRVAYLNSVRQARDLDQDDRIFYLHPPTDDFGLLDFHRIHEIVEAGYQYALPRLKSWNKP